MDRQAEITQAVLKLDAWLDTMRGPDGYGGPVAHWWQDCLQFAGAGLDWRYEGIILGYLSLYERTGDAHWLAKARRAGDDLVRGQLPTGNYRNSSFEMNPYPGGTPHEAACDLALLRLAAVLREAEDPDGQVYARAAEKNLRDFVLGALWDEEREVFRNTMGDPVFVPNKAATIVEALLAWTALSGEGESLARYTRPTLEAIAGCQVRALGTTLDGGIPQRVDCGRGDGRYIPLYIARCIPALVQGTAVFRNERFLEAARAAMGFILRHRLADGSFPQVVYGSGRVNRYPQWVAGAGDILWAMELLEQEGFEAPTGETINWLLGGLQDVSGARTAVGFASQVSQARPPVVPDFRDLLGVCGWADKAFRYLTESEALSEGEALAGLVAPGSLALTPENGTTEIPCLFQGSEAIFYEDKERIEVRRRGERLYRWRKGTAWAKAGPA